MSSSDTIFAALSGLHQTEAKMGRLTDSLHNTENLLKNITSDMNPVWEGRAKEMYTEGSSKLCEQIRSLADEIAVRRRQLSEAVRVYEETEAGNVRQTEDLSVTGLFL